MPPHGKEATMSVAAVKELKELPDDLEIPRGVELDHLAPVIGTEVHGIDLRQALSTENVRFLKRLLLERKVIFFRDQDIDVDQQKAMARHWGALETIDFLPQLEEHPEVLHIKRDAKNRPFENIWHSDVSWRAEPSLGSILRAVEVPTTGGDTLWSCMYSAYDMLPSSIKRACEGVQAVHSVANGLRHTEGEEKMQAMLKRFPMQTHPVVRTHPETGKKTIYVNRAHTSHIKGMRPDVAETLMDILCRQANNPDHQVRFRWKKHSIAFWDNRACQHFACADYFPRYREMYRVTIAGDRPF
jgi:taurine dioxygenase